MANDFIRSISILEIIGDDLKEISMATNATLTYLSSYHFEQILNIEFDPTFLPIAATSFTLFILLYKIVNPILSNVFIHDYHLFNETQKIDWSIR